MFQLKQANIDDINEVIKILRSGRQALMDRGVDQWQGQFPDPVDIRCSIEAGTTYLLVNESHVGVGTFRLLTTPDPTYTKIYDGAWQFNQPYSTIHKLAVHQDWAGKGVGAELFRSAEQIARTLGFDFCRVDTHADNHAMQKLIEKMGYRYSGVVRILDGTTRLAYEKAL